MKIKTALISVSDKKNLKPLLNVLKKNKVKIISSNGTYKKIKKLKFNCIEVSKFINSPEILEGRIKTLHPKIHAGILNKRGSKLHLKDLKVNNFENIDLVIVNFYPFENILKNTNKKDTPYAPAQAAICKTAGRSHWLKARGAQGNPHNTHPRIHSKITQVLATPANPISRTKNPAF